MVTLVGEMILEPQDRSLLAIVSEHEPEGLPIVSEHEPKLAAVCEPLQLAYQNSVSVVTRSKKRPPFGGLKDVFNDEPSTYHRSGHPA